MQIIVKLLGMQMQTTVKLLEGCSQIFGGDIISPRVSAPLLADNVAIANLILSITKVIII